MAPLNREPYDEPAPTIPAGRDDATLSLDGWRPRADVPEVRRLYQTSPFALFRGVLWRRDDLPSPVLRCMRIAADVIDLCVCTWSAVSRSSQHRPFAAGTTALASMLLITRIAASVVLPSARTSLPVAKAHFAQPSFRPFQPCVGTRRRDRTAQWRSCQRIAAALPWPMFGQAWLRIG